MNLLIIEDEPDFIGRVKVAFAPEGSNNQLLTPDAVGLVSEKFEAHKSFEEQFLDKLRQVHKDSAIDLVLLDTDLSRFKGSPISQTLCRQAFQEIGVPVCRYKKTYTQTDSNRLKDLKRIAREGASAVWVPPHLVKGEDLSDLVTWLLAVNDGFVRIRERLQGDPALLEKNHGPAAVLARLLGKPKMRADLLGYTAQNLFFFAAPLSEDADDESLTPDALVQSTRLGYWLLNYVLTFPGPILPVAAAAALLNVSRDAFDDPRLQALCARARYQGPFDRVQPYYLRDALEEIVDENGGSVVNAPALQGVGLEALVSDPAGTHAYYCVLNDKPITAAQAANPSPDWIPPGADMARIDQDLLDALDPMLSK